MCRFGGHYYCHFGIGKHFIQLTFKRTEFQCRKIIHLISTFPQAESKAESRELLDYIEWTFILILVIDCCAKIFANGVKSFLSNIWHVIDLINLTVSRIKIITTRMKSEIQ